jgi:polyisoprenoid-binding protein YceI
MAFIISTSLGTIYAQTFKAQPDKTVIYWHGEKVGGEHDGNIKLKSGELVMSGNKPVSGNVVIDMTTITNSDISNDGMRERLVNHLKSDDFFGVEKFPEARFDITGSEVNDGGSIKLMGNLTIKGISEPVEFISSMESRDGSLVFKGHIEIDRTLFDVRFGSKKFFNNIADSAIDDIFKLDYELVLTKQ